MNRLRTVVLMALLTGIFVVLGKFMAGTQGMVLAFLLAVAINSFSYWLGDKLVLAMYRAREIAPEDAPGLVSTVSRLSQKAALPMPELYLIQTDRPNAFATGRDPHHAALAVTAGILKCLNEDELEGVLAHELSHVKHRDSLIASLVATIAGAIAMLATWARWAPFFSGPEKEDSRGGNILGLIIVMVLAPLAALLIQLTISRSREYLADQGGAELSGRPLSLAKALQKLDSYAVDHPLRVNPSTAHLFIVNPLRGSFLARLFSTHPPTQRRVERLEELAAKRACSKG